MMIQIRDKRWVALYFVLICQQVNLSLGYVTGGLRSYRNCIVKNMACSDVDGRAITSISNINNQVGCDEKCRDTESCKRWTWYDSTANNSYIFDCVLFNECSDVDTDCKYCYTGDRGCFEQPEPYATLVMGGTADADGQSLVSSIEIFAQGQGPVCNVMADIPANLSHGDIIGGQLSDKIYVCGQTSDFSPTCFVYTLPIIRNKGWSNETINPMMTSRTSAASITAYGELYVTGGYTVPNDNGSMASPFIEVFNPATKTWRSVNTHGAESEQPRPRAGHCAVRYRDGIYLLGGESDDLEFISIDILNISTKTWKHFQAPDGVWNLRHLACSFQGNDTILISGGQWLGQSQSGFWSWNITTQIWKELTPLVVPRHSHVMNLFDGLPSVAGGIDSSGNMLNSTETFNDNVWTLNPDGMTLQTGRSRHITVQMSKSFIDMPSRGLFK